MSKISYFLLDNILIETFNNNKNMFIVAFVYKYSRFLFNHFHNLDKVFLHSVLYFLVRSFFFHSKVENNTLLHCAENALSVLSVVG